MAYYEDSPSNQTSNPTDIQNQSSEFNFTTDDETDSFFGESSDSELFTMYCPTCFLSFPDEQSYKMHYKSDLHLYNVKRKLVGLKPATLDRFNKRNFHFPRFQIFKKKLDARNKKLIAIIFGFLIRG